MLLGAPGKPRACYNGWQIEGSVQLCWNELCIVFEKCTFLTTLIKPTKNRPTGRKKTQNHVALLFKQNKEYDRNPGFPDTFSLSALIYLPAYGTLPWPVPKARIKRLCLVDQTPPEISGHFRAVCGVVAPCTFSPAGRTGAGGSGLLLLKTLSAWSQWTCTASFEQEAPTALLSSTTWWP